MFITKRTMRGLALIGLVGPVVWWVLILINGAITPGYSHISDFISTLGAVGAPNAVIQQLNFAVFSGAIFALMLGIHYWFGDGRRPRFVTVLLGVFGVGVILAGVFPENPAAPDSTTNVLHNLVSMIAFLAGIGGVGLVSRRFGADSRWPSYQYEPTGTVIIVLVTFVVFMYSVFSDAAFVGLIQRVFIGVVTIWVVVQAARLHRLVDDWERDEVEDRHMESTDVKTAD